MQLIIENLTFGWNQELLFDRACIQLQPNEIIQLVGENGVGKTTLLSLIAGMVPHFSRGAVLTGDIRLDGRSILKESPQHFFPAIALIPSGNLELFLLTETLNQEVLLTRSMLPIDENTVKKKLTEFANYFPEITALPQEPIDNFSLSQKIVALTFIYYLQNAQLYLFDEVFATFSVRQVRQFYSFFDWLRSNGSSIIFVDHQHDKEKYPQMLLKDKGLTRQ